MDSVKTICVKCRFHNGTLPKAPWHEHHCLHPDVQRLPEQDPVTGREGFAYKDDLGHISIVNFASPYCRTLNHGNCELFEVR